MTDESFLIHPTDAQKPEPYSPVKSATRADRTPSEHWHPAIWEHACMVSDAFPSLVSCIVAISRPGCSLPRVFSRFHHLTDRLLLPPSAPSFPPPPHRRADDRNHCVRHMSVVACGSTTILPSPIAKVVCVPFVAFQSASRAKCRILKWLVGCESNQVDGTIPLDHACPFPQPWKR